MNVQEISNSTVELDDVKHRLSEISYVKNNMLFLKPTKGLRAISNEFLMKNSWVALLIVDTQTNTSKIISRDDILKSDILDYSYNASYINDKTSVRVSEVTDATIAEVDRKVKENNKKHEEKNQKLIERHQKFVAKKQKQEQTNAKNIESGKKVVELMLKVANSDITRKYAVEINGTRYLRYADYCDDEVDVLGYMQIIPDSDSFNKQLYIVGRFLDSEYSLDYQRYETIEVDEQTFKDLGNLKGVCRTSTCDDIGYMNNYLLSTDEHSYEIEMYLNTYDGHFTVEEVDKKANFEVHSIKNLVNNKNTLDILIKLHKLCNELRKYDKAYKIPNIHILKVIKAYVSSEEGKQYELQVNELLKSTQFKNTIYYLILASKLNKANWR